VMNRWVRGILGGLERHRIPALYPGRDTITVRRRQLGIVSYAEVRGGAVLVEAIVATSGDPSVLPRLLDRADPAGVVRTTMLTPADTTSLAAERGSTPTLEEFATWMSGGYAERLGVIPEPRIFDAGETARVAALASGLDDTAWLAQRHARDDLDRRASTATMLGALDVHLAVGPDAHIRDACISGDLIAGHDTVPALEQALRGCAPDRASVAAAVTHALAVPDRFLLGIGPVDTLVDTAMQALG